MKSTTSKSVKPVISGTNPRVIKPALKETRSPLKKSLSHVKWEFPFSKKNYIILGIGMVVLAIGYIFMATALGDNQPVEGGNWANPLAIVWSPILLVIGYCVIIPFGILKYFGKPDETNADNQS
jgi:hypothetical protein